MNWNSTNVRMSISGGLVVLSLVLSILFPSLPRRIRVGAMLASFMGDMMLTNFHPFTNWVGAYNFEKGIVLFASAHVLYCISFALLIKKEGIHPLNVSLHQFGLPLGLTLSILGVAIVFFARRNSPLPAPMLLFLGLLYCLIIGTMCSLACIYSFSKGFWPKLAAFGAVSFLLSDMVIGMTAMGGIKIQNSTSLIWIYYPIGQLLLLLS